MENTQKPSAETYSKWHNDPGNWKLGIFYFNKADKRIFPPKRIRGLGWTVNFANPISILTLVGLCVLAFVVVRFIKNA